MMISILLLLVVLGYLAYSAYISHWRNHSIPILYCKERRLKKLLLDVPALANKFTPTFWANNAHLQTWIRTFFALFHFGKVPCIREYLEMSDEGIVSFDWMSFSEEEFPAKSSRPVLVIMTSTMNDHVSGYTQLCVKALSEGFNPVIFNRRGYSSTPMGNDSSLLAGAKDLEEALHYINVKHPFNDIVVVAFSMEATDLIDYLLTNGQYSRIVGAVCISWNFACHNLPFNRVVKEPYSRLLAEKHMELIYKHKYYENYACRRKCAQRADFQNHALLKKNVVKNNNFMLAMRGIQLPVLFVNSLDDPVIRQQCFPASVLSLVDFCFFLTTNQGGHAGFYEGFFPTSRADDFALSFLNKTLHHRHLFHQHANGYARTRSATCL